MRTSKILTAFAVAVLLTACANHKEPAEKAVAKIEASFSGLKEDAGKYAADELKDIEESIGKLKSQLASQDYEAVVRQAPYVASSLTALKNTVANKKAEAEELRATAQQEWTDLNASMPALVTRLQSRMDSLTRSRVVPKGFDKASFETAKRDFEKLKTSWTEAGSEFTSGLVSSAVRKARAAKAKGDYLAQKLGA
jgi:hypothetical protein